MNREEFANIAMAIKSYYPAQNVLPTPESIELWYRQLIDITYEVMTMALQKWVSLNRWAPTIADLREYALDVNTGAEDDWSEAWYKVLKLISKYGTYNAEKAIGEMDDISKETVRRIGFMRICKSENIAVERANFRDIYNTLATRKKQDKQIPQSLQIAINKTIMIGENK